MSRLFSMFFCLFIIPVTVYAQFEGDIFFDTPSVTGQRGTEVDMSISAFSGGRVLGAAQIDISYDPQQLSVLDVVPSTNKEFQNNFVYRNNNGTISVVTLNDGSTKVPFGTVGLVKITFNVLDSAPLDRAVITTNVRSLLDVNSDDFPGNGFNGEIVFQTASQQTTTKNSQINSRDRIVSPDSNIGKRASGMRPLGEHVILQTEEGPISVFVKNQ
jgi:hypothetical protein